MNLRSCGQQCFLFYFVCAQGNPESYPFLAFSLGSCLNKVNGDILKGIDMSELNGILCVLPVIQPIDRSILVTYDINLPNSGIVARTNTDNKHV